MPFVRIPNLFADAGTYLTVHVRVAKPRRRRCVGLEVGHPCPSPASFQCDHPVGRRKTCSAWCCESHAKTVGPDLHHCPAHVHAQAGLFTSLVVDAGGQV